MSAPLRLGVLGCAEIATRRVLPALAANPTVELAAVASRTPDRAAAVCERWGGVPVGYEALLARADVDAVYIPLPSGLHGTWAARALDAGKHVLVEKPATLAAGETRRLASHARRCGLACVENVMFVHHPQHAAVRALLARGVIGVPRSMTATFTIPRRPATDIRWRPDLGGGSLLDNGLYPVRAALELFGPRWAVAGVHLRHENGVDIGGAALLAGRDGMTACLTFGMDDVYTCRYEVVGTRGRVVVERAFTPPADAPGDVTVHTADGSHAVPVPAFDQYRAALDAFTAAVAGREVACDLRQAELLDEIRALATR